MRRYSFWVVIFAVLFLLSMTYGGEAPKSGIVKGTITIDGKPASDAVVSIEGVGRQEPETRNPKIITAKAVMDQREMKFLPRVLPIAVGTVVDFPNNDNTWHNVFSGSEAKKFDLGLYPAGQSRAVAFDKPGLVRILCNVHPAMEAYVVVKAHPYFSAADSRGNYQIMSVPLGKYRLEVWHPEFGTRATSFIMVREGEVLSIDIDLKARR